MVALTVVDSNVWIFLNLETAPEHGAARSQLEKHRERGLQINAIILSEVFHKLSILLGVEEARGRVNKILGSSFVVYESLSLETAQRALGIASQHRIRINDALIAAHALDARTALLTDNEKDFRRIKGLKLIALQR